MQLHIRRAVQEVGEGNVLVVAGAAHIAALVVGDVDESTAARFERSVPTAVTLVPYSFTRLAEQTGYGAGNRAPRYYQRAHDAGCDFTRATLEVLLDFTVHLRLRGFTASLADALEAYRLAKTLSDMRGKSAPGLDEVREAAIAVLCRGESRHVDGFLWSSVVGHAVGRVSARIGRSSLQSEFWRELDARRLPRSDEAERFVLRLQEPVQVETSIFLHRLRVADVPYAAYLGAQGMGRDDDVGGAAALIRVRETWEARWTPATDTALVENVVHGETFADVAARLLQADLDKARTTGAAADVLLEAIVCAVPKVIQGALAACERLAAVDDDLPSLARAARSTSGLVRYGSSRSALANVDTLLRTLTVSTYTRAVARARDACIGNDAALERVHEALRVLHEVALGDDVVDKALWLEAAHRIAIDFTVHPSASGMCTGLTYLAGASSEEEVTALVTFRLSSVTEPTQAAAYLEGFLGVNALVLARNKHVVAALDRFLQSIPADRFQETLPVLRRAFASLGATERRYLLENMLGIRASTTTTTSAAKAILDERDPEKVAALARDMGQLMDDLDDLL